MGVGRREEEWAHTKSFSLLFVCVPLVCSVLSLSRWATPARHHRRPHCTTYREGKERDPLVSHLWQRFAGRNAIIIIIADDSPLSHWTTVWCTLLFPHPPFHSIHPKGGGVGDMERFLSLFSLPLAKLNRVDTSNDLLLILFELITSQRNGNKCQLTTRGTA